MAQMQALAPQSVEKPLRHKDLMAQPSQNRSQWVGGASRGNPMIQRMAYCQGNKIERCVEG